MLVALVSTCRLLVLLALSAVVAAPAAAQILDVPRFEVLNMAPDASFGTCHPNFCSDTLAVPIGVNASSTVPRPGSLVLKTLATLYSGARDRDKLKLICRT